jgi:dCTP deaminase
MAFLAHSKIIELVKTKNLIDNFNDDEVQQASYDLRLGDEVYIVGKHTPEKLSKKQPYISLAPGQFALLTCLETLSMPDTHMAFITIRSTFKFQGLVNISGFHVDPTYKGKLLFAVQNVGPADIRLKYEEPTFTIFFAAVEGFVGKPRKPGIKGIDLDRVQLLGGSSVTVSKLKKEIDQLRTIVLIYGPFVVATLVALLVKLWKG